MKRVLIDLTDIESWHGHHGGTQRVVYGIAKQFYLHAGQEFSVEFIAFSARENSFYHTSFEPIYERTEKQASVSPSHVAQPAAISLQSRVKQTIRPYVPEAVRKSKYAQATARRTLVLGKVAARKARQKLQARGQHTQHSTGQKVTFTENDIVLILGKPWDNPSMERVLLDRKTEKGFKLVQVIYDLIIPLYPHLHHPSLFKTYTQYFFEAIYGSDLLLPISKSSEKDLKKFAKLLNLPIPKTKVIRLADEIVNQHDEHSKPDPRIAKKFIICVGTIEIRKNHTLLYYAYKLAEQQGIDLPQLVIVGSRGWLSGDFQYLVEHDPLVKDKIIILDNTNDQGLSWVYANCMFSVYPSFYEGWGLPIAEALANGKVCIASNTSSVPEIAGDMIDYFAPYDAQACLELIVKYLDPAVLKQKEAHIQQTYKTTSWDDTFTKVTDGIHEL
jgi:glycosyltransferase involved in cell wall biosynthesis